MTEAATGGEFQPNPLHVLAASMLAREQHEYEWRQTALGEYLPAPAPEQPDEITSAIAAGVTLAKLEITEGPEGVAITPPAMDTALAETVVRTVGGTPDGGSIKTIQTLFLTQVTGLSEAFRADSRAQAEFAAPLQAAKTVAAEHSVPVHAVYDSDELYAESIRVRHTPESHVIELLTLHERENQQLTETTISRLVDSQIREEVNSWKLSPFPDAIAARREALIAEYLQDEPLMAVVASSTATLDTAYRGIVRRSLERFWGKDATDRLDPATRALVVDELPGGGLTAGQSRLQRHNDIVKTICIEMEWDPANLSSTQRRYISMRPEMFDLHGNAE
jgi:hypothetical protein